MFVTGEVMLFDANGRALVMTPAGEAQVEAIQRPNTQFNNILVDPVTPSQKAGVTAAGKLLVETSPATGGPSQNVVITDPVNSGHQALVDASGNLKVTTPPPTPPPNTTQVGHTAFSNVNNDQNDYYTIPNGQTLTINRFESGSETTNSGSVCFLYYDEAGNGNNMEIISVQFHNGSNASSDLGVYIEGDGTKRILMRRTPYGGGSRYIFAQWRGYTRAT